MRRSAVIIAEGALGAIPVWFLGWLIYDVCQLWQVLSSSEMQNILLLMISLILLLSGISARRSYSISATTIKNKTSSRANNPKPQDSLSEPEWVGKLQKDVGELSRKVADLHALNQYLEKRNKGDKDA